MPPADSIIHNFKYQRRTKLGELLGRGMANVLRSDFFLNSVDLLIPVPLFWWKRIRRGYNQSEILASVISKETGIKTANVITRRRNTRTQTKLDIKKREKNVFGAFKLTARKKIKNKNLLLIDDVLTTGATLNECARILKQEGARHVYCLVGAITPG